MAVVALFPEAAFGPALNSVGIGQALQELGHRVVCLYDPGFLEVHTGYGFEAYRCALLAARSRPARRVWWDSGGTSSLRNASGPIPRDA